MIERPKHRHAIAGDCKNTDRVEADFSKSNAIDDTPADPSTHSDPVRNGTSEYIAGPNVALAFKPSKGGSPVAYALLLLALIAGGVVQARENRYPLSDTDPLVPITAVIPDVVLDIRYATADNFLKQPVYPGPHAWLRKSTLAKLQKVADALRAKGFRLRIYDGYRPLSVQKKMWAIKPNSPYVANPKFGSIHNRGGAVDLSLVTLAGEDVLMPSEYDDFSPKAHHGNPKTEPTAAKNAATLKSAMEAAGFTAITSEWWHYNDPATKKYPVLDRNFESLLPSPQPQAE